MRSCHWAAVILLLPLAPATAANSAPTRKLQKVAVVNLAPENTRAVAVEMDIKQDLLKKAVLSESLRALTTGDKKPADVQALVGLIHSQGFESLLCLGARKTIQISSPDKSNDFATLDSCLSTFLTGKYPSGMSLKSEPFIVDAQPSEMHPAGGNFAATPRTPISANAAAAPVTYYKRTIRLFDIPTQALFWEKKIMVKIPTDLQESRQAEQIAHETTKALEAAGFLP